MSGYRSRPGKPTTVLWLVIAVAYLIVVATTGGVFFLLTALLSVATVALTGYAGLRMLARRAGGRLEPAHSPMRLDRGQRI